LDLSKVVEQMVADAAQCLVRRPRVPVAPDGSAIPAQPRLGDIQDLGDGMGHELGNVALIDVEKGGILLGDLVRGEMSDVLSTPLAGRFG